MTDRARGAATIKKSTYNQVLNLIPHGAVLRAADPALMTRD